MDNYCPDAPYIRDAERYGGGYEPRENYGGRAIDDYYWDEEEDTDAQETDI